jgi:hypothetical protein
MKQKMWRLPTYQIQLRVRRPASSVSAEGVAAAVPGANGAADDIAQHPPLARVHAFLVKLASGHVVHWDRRAAAGLHMIGHDLIAAFVDDAQRGALDVLLGAGLVLPVRPVVGNAQLWMAQRVEMDDGRGAGLGRGLSGSASFVRPLLGIIRPSGGSFGSVGRIGAQRVPGGQIVVLEQLAEKIAHVRVFGRVGQHCVVDIEAGLSPGVKDDLFPGVVGVQRGNHAPEGIVKDRRGAPSACGCVRWPGCDRPPDRTLLGTRKRRHCPCRRNFGR